jgi:hypothetical protein
MRREPYTPPPAPFKPEEWVKFEGKRWKVQTSTHTHTQLYGVKYAVANWRLKKSG